MGKFLNFIACAIITIIGIVGMCAEIYRLWEFRQAMNDEIWVGEIMLILFYLVLAGIGIFRAIQLWNEEY